VSFTDDGCPHLSAPNQAGAFPPGWVRLLRQGTLSRPHKESRHLCGRIRPAKLQRRLHAVSNVELLHDVCHVMLYRSLGAFEAPRNFFVGHALRDKREDLLLTSTKITLIVGDNSIDAIALFDQQSGGEGWRHIAVASKDGSHRLNHLVAGTALQNVTPHARLERCGNLLLIFGSRQHDNPDLRISASNVCGRIDAAPRQMKIEQHDVRSAFSCNRYGVGSRRSLPHNLNSVGARQRFHRTLAKYRMVVDDRDPNRVWRRISNVRGGFHVDPPGSRMLALNNFNRSPQAFEPSSVRPVAPNAL
jgi:hypothetical protein